MKAENPSEAPRRKRALVTGITGFTGRYVAAELADAGYDVVGLTYEGDVASPGIYAVDLCDRDKVLALVPGLDADVVVHLAAISFVEHGDAEDIYRVNVLGTRNLLEAIANSAVTPSGVILASSANIYGNANVEPITEETVPAPANDYAVSKLAMEYMAKLWMDKLPIVITRPFNYTGVGQGRQFLVPKIVTHYAKGERRIELGNIDIVRDFMDVRDVARLYRMLAEHAPPGRILNICSGAARSLREIIDIAGESSGYRIEVLVNQKFVRDSEVRRLVGSSEQLQRVVGEFTSRPMEQTVAWMLDSDLPE